MADTDQIDVASQVSRNRSIDGSDLIFAMDPDDPEDTATDTVDEFFMEHQRTGQEIVDAIDAVIGNEHWKAEDTRLTNQEVKQAYLATTHIPVDGVAGDANAIELTPTSAIMMYRNGMRFTLFSKADNTGNVTINVSGLGARELRRPDGTQIPAGWLKNNRLLEIVYRASNSRFYLNDSWLNEKLNATFDNVGTISDANKIAFRVAMSIYSRQETDQAIATALSEGREIITVNSRNDLPAASAETLSKLYYIVSERLTLLTVRTTHVGNAASADSVLFTDSRFRLSDVEPSLAITENFYYNTVEEQWYYKSTNVRFGVTTWEHIGYATDLGGHFLGAFDSDDTAAGSIVGYDASVTYRAYIRGTGMVTLTNYVAPTQEYYTYSYRKFSATTFADLDGQIGDDQIPSDIVRRDQLDDAIRGERQRTEAEARNRADGDTALGERIDEIDTHKLGRQQDNPLGTPATRTGPWRMLHRPIWQTYNSGVFNGDSLAEGHLMMSNIDQGRRTIQIHFTEVDATEAPSVLVDLAQAGSRLKIELSDGVVIFEGTLRESTVVEESVTNLWRVQADQINVNIPPNLNGTAVIVSAQSTIDAVNEDQNEEIASKASRTDLDSTNTALAATNTRLTEHIEDDSRHGGGSGDATGKADTDLGNVVSDLTATQQSSLREKLTPDSDEIPFTTIEVIPDTFVNTGQGFPTEWEIALGNRVEKFKPIRRIQVWIQGVSVHTINPNEHQLDSGGTRTFKNRNYVMSFSLVNSQKDAISNALANADRVNIEVWYYYNAAYSIYGLSRISIPAVHPSDTPLDSQSVVTPRRVRSFPVSPLEGEEVVLIQASIVPEREAYFRILSELGNVDGTPANVARDLTNTPFSEFFQGDDGRTKFRLKAGISAVPTALHFVLNPDGLERDQHNDIVALTTEGSGATLTYIADSAFYNRRMNFYQDDAYFFVSVRVGNAYMQANGTVSARESFPIGKYVRRGNSWLPSKPEGAKVRFETDIGTSSPVVLPVGTRKILVGVSVSGSQNTGQSFFFRELSLLAFSSSSRRIILEGTRSDRFNDSDLDKAIVLTGSYAENSRTLTHAISGVDNLVVESIHAIGES